MEDELMALRHRMERAEGQVRFMRYLLLAGLLCTIGLLVVRPSVAEENGTVLKTPVQVVNQQGKIVATIEDRSGGRFHLHGNRYANIVGMEAAFDHGAIYYKTAGSVRRVIKD